MRSFAEHDLGTNTYSCYIRYNCCRLGNCSIHHIYNTSTKQKQKPRETTIYGIMVNSGSDSSTTRNDLKRLSEPLLGDKDLERGGRSSKSDNETLLRRGGTDKNDKDISIETYDRARRFNERLFRKALAAMNVMITLLKLVVLYALFAVTPQITTSHYLEVGYQSLSEVMEFVLPGPTSQRRGVIVTFAVYVAALLYHDLYHFLEFRLVFNLGLLLAKGYRIRFTLENDKYIYATHAD